MAALYQKVPSQDAANPLLQAIARAAENTVIQVWPENWLAVQLFCKFSTQWRVAAGPIGLVYEAVYPLLDRIAASPDEWDELFSDIQHMERAALDAMKD